MKRSRLARFQGLRGLSAPSTSGTPDRVPRARLAIVTSALSVNLYNVTAVVTSKVPSAKGRPSAFACTTGPPVQRAVRPVASFGAHNRADFE
jgi:hypothetical protein